MKSARPSSGKIREWRSAEVFHTYERLFVFLRACRNNEAKTPFLKVSSENISYFLLHSFENMKDVRRPSLPSRFPFLPHLSFRIVSAALSCSPHDSDIKGLPCRIWTTVSKDTCREKTFSRKENFYNLLKYHVITLLYPSTHSVPCCIFCKNGKTIFIKKTT